MYCHRYKRSYPSAKDMPHIICGYPNQTLIARFKTIGCNKPVLNHLKFKFWIDLIQFWLLTSKLSLSYWLTGTSLRIEVWPLRVFTISATFHIRTSTVSIDFQQIIYTESLSISSEKDNVKQLNYTGCTQWATPKLPKKVGTLPWENRDEIFDKKMFFCLFCKTKANLWWITVECVDISGRKQLQISILLFWKPCLTHFRSFLLHIGCTRCSLRRKRLCHE